MTVVEVLDHGSVFVFALTGALVASRAQLDIVGFLFIACLTAVGGGTLRDLLLERDQVFWVANPSVLAVAIVAAVSVFFAAHLLESRARAIEWLDACALAIAVPAGVAVAQSLGQPWAIVLIMGVTTGCFGGLMRDVVCNEVPLLLRQGQLYATAAFAGSGAAVLAAPHIGTGARAGPVRGGDVVPAGGKPGVRMEAAGLQGAPAARLSGLPARYFIAAAPSKTAAARTAQPPGRVNSHRPSDTPHSVSRIPAPAIVPKTSPSISALLRAVGLPQPDQHHRAQHGADKPRHPAGDRQQNPQGQPADQCAEDTDADGGGQVGINLHQPRGDEARSSADDDEGDENRHIRDLS